MFTLVFLLIPLAGNAFVPGWHWRPGGFVVVGLIVFGAAVAFQLVTRASDALAYKAGCLVAFVCSLGLVWSSLVHFADVTPIAAVYFGVPVVGAIGAAIARLRPAGMARAMMAMMAAQGIAFGIAFTHQKIQSPWMGAWTPPEIRGLVGNAVLILAFGASAFLFRLAARPHLTSEDK